MVGSCTGHWSGLCVVKNSVCGPCSVDSLWSWRELAEAKCIVCKILWNGAQRSCLITHLYTHLYTHLTAHLITHGIHIVRFDVTADVTSIQDTSVRMSVTVQWYKLMHFVVSETTSQRVCDHMTVVTWLEWECQDKNCDWCHHVVLKRRLDFLHWSVFQSSIVNLLCNHNYVVKVFIFTWILHEVAGLRKTGGNYFPLGYSCDTTWTWCQ